MFARIFVLPLATLTLMNGTEFGVQHPSMTLAVIRPLRAHTEYRRHELSCGAIC